MSFEKEFQDFLSKDEPKPEDIFSMVTIMPKKKIKVTAYLEDKDGEKLLTSEVAENLVEYVVDQMHNDSNTPVNSQLFPLCGQFMTSIVPRFVGLDTASILFQASGFRDALLYLSLSSVLFMQYIEQHGLKIVTEVTTLSDEEVTAYVNRSQEADERMRRAFEYAFHDEENEDDESA